MCGIFGLFNPHKPLSTELITSADAMASALSHRGPDGHGAELLFNTQCLLGHTRLSIIDLDGGKQPPSNENSSIWITLNGEVYNYIELRHELLAKGHIFKTTSDTETLVHLYEEYGTDMFEHIVGMFAFAIIDQNKETLLIARDRLGEKPLYHTVLPDGTLAFASEIKALLLLPGIEIKPDWTGIAQFLALRYMPPPRTHLYAVNKLPPANYAVIKYSTDINTINYWNIKPQEHKKQTQADLIGELKNHLAAAVKVQLRSDVPLGAFLSGGIDSAIICATAAQHMPPCNLNTFCIGFDNPLLDESANAAITAKAIGTNHHTINVQFEEAYKHLKDLVNHYDEPLGDVSMLPTWIVCREARKYVKVILSGDGGDESFGGYSQYFNYSTYQALRKTPLVQPFSSAIRSTWKKLRFRGIGFIEHLAKTNRQLNIVENDWNFAQSVLGPEHICHVETAIAEWEQKISPFLQQSFPTSAMRTDLLVGYLPNQILVKVDRASMLAGLESRAPFLDHKLVEFAMQIPIKQHIQKNIGKYLLRKALPASIPAKIRWGAKKGFTPPWSDWLRGPLKQTFTESLNSLNPISQSLNIDLITMMFKQHCNGADHSDMLFRWFALSHSKFSKQFTAL